jgi:membrane associated rhomboid family serine protease
MIPIGDENPTRRFPIVNYLLIAANILYFVYQLGLGNQLDQYLLDVAIRSLQVTELLNGDLRLLLPVLIASTHSMFLHGGWLHIIGNLVFLWVFGDNIEDNFGSLVYFVFYMLAGYGAVLAQAWLEPQSNIPMIGASGAVSGVLAAYLLLYPGKSILAIIPLVIIFFPLRVPAWLMIIVWFAGQLLNGYAALTDQAMMTGGVAYGAHIGGFIVGFVLAMFLRKPQRPPRYEQRYSYRR